MIFMFRITMFYNCIYGDGSKQFGDCVAFATRAFATPIFVASATPIFVASATPYFRTFATRTAATPKILEKRDSHRLLVQSGKDHLISVVIAKFLYYFPQSIHLSFWFWYMCHWDISFPIFCDIIRPIFGHLPSHFLDAAASLASTG